LFGGSLLLSFPEHQSRPLRGCFLLRSERRAQGSRRLTASRPPAYIRTRLRQHGWQGEAAVDLFPTMTEKAYESVHFFHDAATGLRAIVALHDTTFGPGLGGTRAISTYASEAAAVDDVLRLARGMTFKATLANIPFGGGKAVIMLPKEPFDRPALFEAFGRAVDTLGGRYITTEDAGTSPEDVAHMRRGTKHVVGMPREMGG